LLQFKELLETEKLKLNQEIQKQQTIIEEKDALFNNAQAKWDADKKRTDSELNELQHLTEQLKQKDIEVTQSQEQHTNEIHVQLREKNTEISKLNEKDIETESNLKEVTKKLEHSQKQIEAQIKQLQEKDTHIKEIIEQKEQLENTQLRSNEQVKLLNETIQNQTSALEQFKIDLEKTRQKITQVENIKNAEIEVLTKQMEVKEKEIKSAYAAASEEEKSKLFEDKIQQLQDTLNTKNY